MKWSTVVVNAPVSASIGIRAGAPKAGAGEESVGAGIELSAMSLGAAVDVLGTPFAVTNVPVSCAAASAGVVVTPVPVAPAVPTAVIVTVCGFVPVGSIVSVLPAVRPVTLATLMFVSPAAAGAASVVCVMRKLRVCQVRYAAPASSVAPDTTSDVRSAWATVCVAVAFGTTSVDADQLAPQSFEANQLTPPPPESATTTRPHTVPGAAPGGGGCTSVTVPVPVAASDELAGADHVFPPSEELTTCTRFAGVDAVLV